MQFFQESPWTDQLNLFDHSSDNGEANAIYINTITKVALLSNEVAILESTSPLGLSALSLKPYLYLL